MTELRNNGTVPEEDADPETLARGPEPANRPSSLAREILFVIVICAAQLMTQAGLALSITPLHIIGDTFHVDQSTLSWSPAGYSLTVGTFILAAGRLGDLYGHRLLVISGWTWFGLWSILAGVAVWSGVIFFDFCRAMQGIGPALLLPNSLAILARTYPPGPRKNMLFSLFGATAPGGFTIGSVFSALLAQRVWWPWAYWIMAIACFSLAMLAIFVVPKLKQEASLDDGATSSFARIDALGASTGITALVLINFAWNQGPVVGWTVPYTYILLIIGFLFLGLFIFVERRAACPLVPPNIFKGEVGWVLGCISAGWSSFGVLVYYFFQIMEVLKGDSPLLATAKFCGVSAAGLIAAITNGFLLGSVRPSIIMLAAMLAFTAGQLLLATLPLHQIYWTQAFVLTIVTPWGMDMSFPAGTIIISNSMSREHQGLAASLVNTVVNYSISIGLGLAGTVESNVNDGGKETLRGYRGACYLGVGLAGLGAVLAGCFVVVTCIGSRKEQQ